MDSVLSVLGTEDENNYTHVNNYPLTKLHIPIEKINKLYLNYIKYAKSDNELFLSEAINKTVPPLISTLSLKYEVIEDGIEPYTDTFINYIIYCHQEAIRLTLQPTNDKKELYCCYLENDMTEDDDKNWCIEIRLQFPYCKVDSNYQEAVMRPLIIKLLHTYNPFSQVVIQPIGSWDTIIGKGTSFKPLLFYNSVEKPDQNKLVLKYIINEISRDIFTEENYEIKHLPIENVFDLRCNRYVQDNVIAEKTLIKYSHEELLPLFLSANYWNCIMLRQNKKAQKISDSKGSDDENSDKEESEKEISDNSASDSEERKVSKKKPKKNNKKYSRFSDSDEFNDKDGKFAVATIVIKLLNKNRFTNPIFWRHIGICLYNITGGHICGFNLWTDMSKKYKSELWKDYDDCKYTYDTFQTCVEKYTEKTLAIYAREDNKKGYYNWHDKWVQEIIIRIAEAPKILDYDVQEAIYRMFWLDFLCFDVDKKGWVQFKNHHYVRTQKGINLKALLSKDFVYAIDELRIKLIKQKKEYREDEKKINQSEELVKRLGTIISNMKTESKINTYMRGVETFFFDPDFTSKMDNNGNLTGCTNGVLEVMQDICLFRPGKPEDFITMSTNIAYPSHYTWEHPMVKATLKYYKQMFIDEELIDYMWKLNACSLMAGNNNKIFLIHTGVAGNNSKSINCKLSGAAWGDYDIQCDESIVFGKQGSGKSGPSPEIARMKNVRKVSIVEPDADSKMSDGKIKKYTGGDAFYGRMLNENGGDIIATFVLHMFTNNIPVPENAGKAIVERIRVAPYNSVWSYNAPDSEEEQFKQRHFKRDNFFNKEIPKMAPAYLWLCVQYWSKYVNNGLAEPECVKEATAVYWKESDIYFQFINESIIIHSTPAINLTAKMTNRLTLADIYKIFKIWYKEAFPGVKIIPSSKLLRNELNARWGVSPTAEWGNVSLREITEVQY